MATFTWIPDIGAGQDRAPRIRSAQFGDGYKQRAQDGLNADLRTRSLSFTGRSLAESQAIQAFLEARGGVTSFDYTHPGDSSRKYICESWKAVDVAYNVQNVSATFIQVPA
jgi:phage-related protein